MPVELHSKLLTILDKGIANGDADCVSVLIRRHDHELCYVQSGFSDRRTNTPISRNTIFRMFSQSKPVTAAAVGLLMERGELDIRQPVKKFLPGFENTMVFENGKTVPAQRDILVYHLLSMTAGLSYPSDQDAAGLSADALFKENAKRMCEGRGMDTVEFANRIGQLPLAFHPGDHFRYSTCADVAGAIVEIVSGKRFGDFLRDELFLPLGMKDTAFYIPEEKAHRLAVPLWRQYHQPNSAWQGEYLCCDICHHEPAFQSGGAGLYSTIDDYAAFAQMLLNHGSYNGKRVLSAKTVEFLTTPQLDEKPLWDFHHDWDNQGGFSYGKFVRVCEEPGKACTLAGKGEYGWGGWLGTELINFPEEDATLLYMTSVRNDAADTGLYHKVRNVVLSHE